MSEVGISESLRLNYEDYYGDEDSEWRRLGAVDKARNIMLLCKDLPHRTIMEIGAGEGSILQRLSDEGFGDELYAVEISRSGLAAIERRALPRMVDSRLFDGYTIPYPDRRFDLAILSHVLEHVEHPRQLLYEAARVARYLCIEVPLEDMDRLPRDFVFDKVGHINHYSPRTIRWLLQSSNLRVLREMVTNPSKATYRYQLGRRGLFNYYVKEILLALAPSLATRYFSFHATLTCKREE